MTHRIHNKSHLTHKGNLITVLKVRQNRRTHMKSQAPAEKVKHRAARLHSSINLIRKSGSLFTCSWSAVPPLVEPLDLLSLQRTTSAFYKGDKQPYGCESLYNQQRKNPEYIHTSILNALESGVNERAPSSWSRAEADYFIWSDLLTVMSILNSNCCFFGGGTRCSEFDYKVTVLLLRQ